MRRWRLWLFAWLVCLPTWVNENALACSSHGTISGTPATMRADVFGDLDGDGLINGRLGIVDTFIAPTTTANCVAGVGVGNFDVTAPAGFQVTSAQIAIVNQRTGTTTPLSDFSFAANALTTSGMATGGNGNTPLWAGSAWFGFSSTVAPFTLPTLGRDEAFELQFDVEIPASVLPLSIPVQFAAGEGDPLGAPIFTGGHPVGYFTAADQQAQFATVPEPASILLWLAGIAALLVCRLRMQKP